MNEVYKNNAGLELEILVQNGKQCLVKFVLSGSVRQANIDNIRTGKVKDLYFPSYYNIAYQGEFKKVYYWKQANQLWRNMIKRCYSDVDPRGYKKHGTTVDSRWLCFANFLEDLPKLKGFDLWLKGGMNLDKDLGPFGCNVYSKFNCQFVEESVNKSAGKAGKRLVNGEWITPTR